MNEWMMVVFGGWKFAWRQFDLIGSYMKQIANLRQMTTRW
jgi:hypothetical protein